DRLGDKLVLEAPQRCRAPLGVESAAHRRSGPLVLALRLCLQQPDKLAGQFLRRGDDELVADADKGRTEIEADVVDVRFQLAILGEAIGDDIATVVLLLAEPKAEL